MRISPLRASRANAGPRRNWAGTSIAAAGVHSVESSRMVERIIRKMVRGSVVGHRRRPGRGRIS